MQIQPSIINIFEKAVRKAGRRLTRDFGEIENLQIQSKNIGDFVTNEKIPENQTEDIIKSYNFPYFLSNFDQVSPILKFLQ